MVSPTRRMAAAPSVGRTLSGFLSCELPGTRFTTPALRFFLLLMGIALKCVRSAGFGLTTGLHKILVLLGSTQNRSSRSGVLLSGIAPHCVRTCNLRHLTMQSQLSVLLVTRVGGL